MPYDSRHRYKTNKLTDEESEVQLALKDYHFDGDRSNIFCPISVLYDTYRQYVARQQFREWGVGTLTRQQFGIALRRVFMLDVGDRSRRWINKKQVYGYLGVVGPGSLNIGDYFGGRRPADHDYFIEENLEG